jgi:hypothetical protein
VIDGEDALSLALQARDRETHGTSLREAKDPVYGKGALRRYFEASAKLASRPFCIIG